MPGGADRERVAVATEPGRTYFFLLAGGVLAALVAGYLLAGGGWFRPVLGTVTAENPGSPAKVASGPAAKNSRRPAIKRSRAFS